jgi:ParB/RepB/Spo0J family partition protein
MMKCTTKKIVRWRISKLKPHPRQPDLFPDLPNPQLRTLADDMKKNGLIHPIEILPDGTVIAGHQRVRAAQMLGWIKIRCWVREDLAEAGPAAVERRLIEDNANRRQLSRLEMARCYKRLKELGDGPGHNHNGSGDIRDLLAKQFNLAGRSLDRYARVLDTPREVQQAFDAGQLRLIDAGKVAGLKRRVRTQIAERIRAGESPADVVKEYLPKKPAQRIDRKTLGKLIWALKQGADELSEKIDTMDLRLWTDELPNILSGKEFLERVVQKIGRDSKRNGR